MADDAFVIIETTPKPKPKPVAKPKPVIVEESGRTLADLTPQQQVRVRRSQSGPFFVEPIYIISGPTGRWRVGREIGSEEQTIAEFVDKIEAMECFRCKVAEFFGRG
jgi:hypothetical protein